MLHKRVNLLYNVKATQNIVQNGIIIFLMDEKEIDKQADYCLFSMISANNFLARSNLILTLLKGSPSCSAIS